jgi:hypothetical protein
LFDELVGLLHLLHANQVAVVAVASSADEHRTLL